MSGRPLRSCAAHVAVPLALGVAIYVLWRSREIHLFPGLAALGLAAPVNTIRALAASSRPYVPSFVLYNLPDALWSYALGAWLTGAWSTGGARTTWLVIGLAFVVGAEGLQGVGVLPGTFDAVDLVASVGGYGLALALALARPRPRLVTPTLERS